MKKNLLSCWESIHDLFDTVCELENNANLAIHFQSKAEYGLIEEPRFNLSETEFNLFIETSEVSRVMSLYSNDLNEITFVLSKQDTCKGCERVTKESFIDIVFNNYVTTTIHPYDTRIPKVCFGIESKFFINKRKEPSFIIKYIPNDIFSIPMNRDSTRYIIDNPQKFVDVGYNINDNVIQSKVDCPFSISKDSNVMDSFSLGDIYRHLPEKQYDYKTDSFEDKYVDAEMLMNHISEDDDMGISKPKEVKVEQAKPKVKVIIKKKEKHTDTISTDDKEKDGAVSTPMKTIDIAESFRSGIFGKLVNEKPLISDIDIIRYFPKFYDAYNQKQDFYSIKIPHRSETFRKLLLSFMTDIFDSEKSYIQIVQRSCNSVISKALNVSNLLTKENKFIKEYEQVSDGLEKLNVSIVPED